VVLIIDFLRYLYFLAPSSEDVVTVTGSSTIKAMPDLIGVYYTIQTKGKTSEEEKMRTMKF
jgi:uncharacterized protein YggE